jgi:hypothetical protein
MRGQRKATLGGLDPERRQKVSTVQGRKIQMAQGYNIPILEKDQQPIR